MEMVLATKEICKTCKYSDIKGGCNYILVTGKRRARDKTGEWCGSYEAGKRVKTDNSITLD